MDRTGWSTAEENHRTKRREGSGKMPNWIRKDKQVTRKYARDSVRVKTKTLVSFPFPGVPMGCLQYYIKDRDAIYIGKSFFDSSSTRRSSPIGSSRPYFYFHNSERALFYHSHWPNCPFIHFSCRYCDFTRISWSRSRIREQRKSGGVAAPFSTT